MIDVRRRNLPPLGTMRFAFASRSVIWRARQRYLARKHSEHKEHKQQLDHTHGRHDVADGNLDTRHAIANQIQCLPLEFSTSPARANAACPDIDFSHITSIRVRQRSVLFRHNTAGKLMQKVHRLTLN
jgi:hypothetical protein